MDKVPFMVEEGKVFELDRESSYLIVMSRKTGAGPNNALGLCNALKKSGISAVILVTDDPPELAAAVFEEKGS